MGFVRVLLFSLNQSPSVLNVSIVKIAKMNDFRTLASCSDVSARLAELTSRQQVALATASEQNLSASRRISALEDQLSRQR